MVVRPAPDLVVPLDDALDPRERLALLAGLLPADATYSHGTAAALLGTHVDMPIRAHVAVSGRDVDRYALTAADDWLVLRSAARHAEFPTVVVDRTRRALTSRGWRPGMP